MIKVINKGHSTFQMICPICGCEFSYDLDDLTSMYYVHCPGCHYSCKHPDQTPKVPDKKEFWYVANKTADKLTIHFDNSGYPYYVDTDGQPHYIKE